MQAKGIVLNANAILLAMAENGLTIGEFCKKADIFAGTYRRIMKGEEVKPKTASKVAKALDLKVKDLLQD